MKKIANWFYSKDFSFWQNCGHITVVGVIAFLFFHYLFVK